MLINMRKKQSGLSIVEILIGLVISIIVAVAVLGVFTSTFNASDRVLQRGKLDRDLSAIMDIIANDVQRAGYWSNSTSSGATNPFMTGTNDITVNGSANCLTFAYYNNNTSTTSTNVNATDKFGYGISGGAIKFYQSGDTFDCSAVANWNSLSDTNSVTVTGFNVTSTNTPVAITGSTSTINYRKITITITGNLTNSSTDTKTITRTINVYNNKYIP